MENEQREEEAHDREREKKKRKKGKGKGGGDGWGDGENESEEEWEKRREGRLPAVMKVCFALSQLAPTPSRAHSLLPQPDITFFGESPPAFSREV